MLFGTNIVSKREHDAGDTDDCNIVEDAVERQGWAWRSLLRATESSSSSATR